MAITEKLTAIADTIRSYNPQMGDIKMRLEDMPMIIPDIYNSGFTEGYTLGFETGKNDFTSKVKGLRYFFATMNSVTQNMEIFNEVLQSDLSNLEQAGYMCSNNTQITEFNTNNTFNPEDMENAFFGCSNLVKVSGLDNMTRIANLTRAFMSCPALTDVGTIYINENTTITHAFSLCPALEEIRIAGTIGQTVSFGNSKNLSKASIESIINSLSPNTTGLTVTIPRTAVVNHYGDIDSEEWVSLRKTKTNWTIGLG